MTAQPQSSPLLSVRDLAVHFPIGGQAVVRAVDGAVSYTHLTMPTIYSV